MSKINPIYYWENASGYTAIIAGRFHGAETKEELLDRAYKMFPHLEFQLVRKV